MEFLQGPRGSWRYYMSSSGWFPLSRFFLEHIDVYHDDSWSPGATVSFHGVDREQRKRDLLFTQENCPKELRWKPSRPEPLASCGSDIIIKYIKGGLERTDVVAPYSVLEELAERAKYDENGEAVIEFQHKFSFGEAFCRFRVKKRHQSPSSEGPNSPSHTIINNNYIHNGDTFSGNIYGGNNGGRNNVNSISMGSM